MSKELSLLDAPFTLPAYLQGIDSGISAELMAAVGGQSLNRIGTKGSRFRQVVLGEEVGVFDENYLDVIIVGAAPAVSRRFYTGAYDSSGDNAPPTCYSVDGLFPAEDVHQKQAEKCNLCAQNIKGSKTTDTGGKAKACSYFRRLVVVLAGDTEGMLYRLDVTSMGLFGESQAKAQKYALNDYAKALKSRGLDAGILVTRLSFDTDQSVPKLLFQPARCITEADVAMIATIDAAQKEAYLDVSMKTVDISEESAGSAPELVKPDTKPAQKPKPTPKPKAKPTPEPEPELSEDEIEEAALKEQMRKLQERKIAAAAATSKPAAQRTSPPAAQQAKPAGAQTAAAAPAVVEVGTDEELNDILGGLGL
jgi:hypothetical protein